MIMKRGVPDNLSFDEFKALADRKPSLDGNWLYRLNHQTFYEEYSYPEFRLYSTIYMFTSYEDAVRFMRENLADKEGEHDTYRFELTQIPIAQAEYRNGAMWIFDHYGQLIDYNNIFEYSDDYLESSFFGRSCERIRFHEGDIVEVIWKDTVHLAIVASEGPTVEWFWDLYNRSKDKYGYPSDVSDDCYYVTDAPGDHDHPNSLYMMKPGLPIDQDIKDYFEYCLELQRKGEYNNDPRQLYMNESSIFDAKKAWIFMRYSSKSQRHILYLSEENRVTGSKSLKPIPGNFYSDELLKIKEWLLIKKYGKTRLWYLLKYWNENWSGDDRPPISPDTQIDYFFTKNK